MEFSEGLRKQGSRSRAMTGTLIVAVVVALAAVVTTVVVYTRYHSLQVKNQSTQLTNDQVAQRVNKVFAAPNEKPSVAQIADKSKLTSPFFQNAQKGDYVLIYPKAKIAVIYRPSNNQLVNAGPIATN